MGGILGAISLLCAWVILFYLEHQIRQLRKRIEAIEKK